MEQQCSSEEMFVPHKLCKQAHCRQRTLTLPLPGTQVKLPVCCKNHTTWLTLPGSVTFTDSIFYGWGLGRTLILEMVICRDQ